MNIFNALYKMGVSLVMEDGKPRLRGERAKEAGKMFVLQRENLIDEASMYPAIGGVEHSVIDQARAIASVWDWSEGDWEFYWDRTEDILGRTIDFTQAVNAIYQAEQVTHAERYT